MAHAVIKIGGCNGSGKTTLMRAVIDIVQPGPVEMLSKTKIAAYRGTHAEADVMILGDYSPHRACGGMDTISDKDVRFGLVKKHAQPGNVVLFEGLITGKTFGALGELSNQRGQHGRWLYVMMDTPFEECVRRVLERRAAKGNTSPFDPERTMRPTYKSIYSTAERAMDHGHPVHWINHKDKPAVAARKLMARAMEVYRA